ncbi:hypothetical protein [Nocardiopsis suaedae]|uniref:Uncharacterized protein n=1 Tax=Nocardiopsis suaedae TaxID=3018444 RepID=A0ABT4TJ90_9ACTN|nr:hypothetical protein [Nocardiopsis suaedae]MDA2804758.1 hypothetical protein [Nocardiopsis suaedae]
MLFIDLLEAEQWKYAAIAAAVLTMAALYFCFRRVAAVLAWTLFPAFLLSFPLAGNPSRHFTVTETFYASTFLFASFAVLFAALRPDMRKSLEKHAAGEEHVVPKWKMYVFCVALTVVMIVVCFPLDAATD